MYQLTTNNYNYVLQYLWGSYYVNIWKANHKKTPGISSGRFLCIYATFFSKSKQGQRLQRLLSDFLYFLQHFVFRGFEKSPV